MTSRVIVSGLFRHWVFCVRAIVFGRAIRFVRTRLGMSHGTVSGQMLPSFTVSIFWDVHRLLILFPLHLQFDSMFIFVYIMRFKVSIIFAIFKHCLINLNPFHLIT